MVHLRIRSHVQIAGLRLIHDNRLMVGYRRVFSETLGPSLSSDRKESRIEISVRTDF